MDLYELVGATVGVVVEFATRIAIIAACGHYVGWW